MLKNKALWIGLAVVLLAAGVFCFGSAASAKATTGQATFRVERGPLTISVMQSGRLKPVIC